MFKYANCDIKLCDTSHKILKCVDVYVEDVMVFSVVVSLLLLLVLFSVEVTFVDSSL